MTWELKAIRFDMTYALRQKVLWPGRSIADVMVEGDEAALHLGAFCQGQNIGVISLFSHERSVQFRKLAVVKEYQGFGVGTALIRESIASAKLKGAHTLWCDARIDALVFYQKLGFSIGEQEFMKSGKKYRKALMNLSVLPPA